MHDALSSSAPDESEKRCGSCRAIKPLTAFNRKSSRADGRQEVCRECNRTSSREYYRRNREHHVAVIRERTNAQKRASIAFVCEYLRDHPCADCGEADLRVLDFDHRPGSEKRDGVMQLVRNGFSIAVVAAEVEKCDVRCRNCHAIVTYERMGENWRSLAMNDPLRTSVPESYS
ncbi:hypothetical protein [Microbacterium sp. TPD7012]|uniref:hypothetical protein n=1 Tax=Microbacterium sp. TPD7012 TaxID=2171975 RepID=UPI000D513E01|nr:hypothetical protein [Microbacterium sp. TPD7012]PVE94943.1 hypothetical protein DC434_13520 [Microbacterium sp. TPD7012]